MKIAVTLLLIAPAAIGQHLGVGIKAGVPFTDALSAAVVGTGGSAIRYFTHNDRYTLGPMVDLRLPLIGFEVDALYKPLNYGFVTTAGGTTNVSASSWEFPITGKLHLPTPIIKPYAEAGVSFRTFTGNHFELNAQSNKGFVLGSGLDIKIPFLRIAPELRYTHWGKANFAGLIAGDNQFEFLVGFTH